MRSIWTQGRTMKIQGNSGFAASRQLRRTKATCIAGFVVAFTLCIVAVPLFSAPPTAVADRNYGKAPVAFEPNRGQSDSQVKFLARADGYTLFLTPAEAVFLLKAARAEARTGQVNSEAGAALRVRFLHASEAAPMQATKELIGKVNYLRSKDPNTWHTDIPTFAEVAKRGVYPGIDVVYYGNQRQLEYDFVVAPGANPRAIALSFTGAENVKVDAKGDLVIPPAAGEVLIRRPLAYQEGQNGEREIVAANYTLRSAHNVSIKVGTYDKRRRLVIDPILEYSTYVGGSNIDGANAIA